VKFDSAHQAHGGDHGGANRKYEEEEEAEAICYVLTVILKSTFTSTVFTILHHRL